VIANKLVLLAPANSESLDLRRNRSKMEIAKNAEFLVISSYDSLMLKIADTTLNLND
jgi:hypothetical protein